MSMKKNKFAPQVLTFIFIIISFIACDSDFATLTSEVINPDVATSFRIETDPSDVIIYTKPLGPVQSNDFGANLNTLGIYDDVFGRTTSSFVTQVIANSYAPDFGTVEEEVRIDSVVLTIPYFNIPTDVDDEGNITYSVDSILPKGDTYKSLKLRVFENNYFIRDFDPNADFNDSQDYFSNKTASTTESISDASLEGEELIMLHGPQTSYTGTNDFITISDEGFVLEGLDTDEDEDTDPQILERQPPGIRVKLDPAFWQSKIIDKQDDPVLSSQSDFLDYFKGLYFKAEAVNGDGSYLMLNTGNSNANVTIYHSKLNTATDDTDDRVEGTYAIRFGPNRINFYDNDFVTPIPEGNPETGDSKIYLKGGEGSIAGIKLFDGFYDEGAGITNFDKFRSDFVNLVDNKFVSAKRLVNEANLVVYVDQDIEQVGDEPNRLYLYDVANKSPLVDYFLDGVNNSLPSFSISNHLGALQRVGDEQSGAGIKYKFKITEHINNLLLRDSTNVDLGLAVSLNVNIEEFVQQRNVQNINNEDILSPASSVITPRGIILHGNTTENESKRVYLEIYYTEPNN